tara:strand:+ start:39 stop:248 length:210 start_codon:yes stop_codon:yes gene_type:complete
MRKALDIISVLSFLISGGMACGSFFMYKYVSSPQFKDKVMQEVMGNVKDLLPGQIDKKLPKVTGKMFPL